MFFYFPVMISEEGLDKFIKLYEEKYAVRLEKQQAYDMFAKLITIVTFTNSTDNDLPDC